MLLTIGKDVWRVGECGRVSDTCRGHTDTWVVVTDPHTSMQQLSSMMFGSSSNSGGSTACNANSAICA